jgi:hypothetical protein
MFTACYTPLYGMVANKGLVISGGINMKTISLVCFFINVGIAIWAVNVESDFAPIALATVCAGICLASYLQRDE